MKNLKLLIYSLILFFSWLLSSIFVFEANRAKPILHREICRESSCDEPEEKKKGLIHFVLNRMNGKGYVVMEGEPKGLEASLHHLLELHHNKSLVLTQRTGISLSPFFSFHQNSILFR